MDSIKFTFKTELLTLNQALDKCKMKLKVRQNRYKKRTYVGSMYDLEAKRIKANIQQEAIEQHKGLLILTKNHLIKFVWYVKDRKSDPDNILHGSKYILDGLQNAGMLPNDGWNNVGGGQIHAFFVDKSNPRVEVYFIEGNFNEELRSLNLNT